MTARVLFAALFALALATGACRTAPMPSTGVGAPDVKVTVEGGSYTRISAARLNDMLGNKDFLLINVHIPYDGEIARTDAFIPYDSVEANVKALPPGKDAKMVVYCRTGYMSAIAATTLVRLGYTNVMDLDGGMAAWQSAGFTLIHR